MKQITNLQKVRILQKANPRLTEKEACLLLGIKQDDMDKEKISEIEVPDFINNLFGGFGKKK